MLRDQTGVRVIVKTGRKAGTGALSMPYKLLDK